MGEFRLGRKWQAACLAIFCFLFISGAATQAIAAEEKPYEYDALASLIGGCGTSKIDPVEDPGCPGGVHPPKKFSKPLAVAVDAHGNQFVASYGAGGSPEGAEGRIDVFDSKGFFITEVVQPGALSVAVDSDGVLYATAQVSGSEFEFIRYVPTEYKPEEGKIKYGAGTLITSAPAGAKYGLAVDLSNDHVFLSRGHSIIEFGSLAEENKLLDTITHERLFSSYFLAVDSDRRRLYSSSCPDGDIDHCWVIVLNADKPEELLEEVTGENTPEEEFLSNKGWTSIAVDEKTGAFFIGDLELTKRIYKFNVDYEYLSTLEFEFIGGNALQIAVSNAPVPVGNHRYLYAPSHPAGVGHAFAFKPPGVEAPKVESVSVDNIGETEAELQAEIEPNGGVTAYTFQLITQQAYEEAGGSFTGAPVVREGTIAGDRQEARVFAPVGGLAPGTAYRFRVFVENEKGEDEGEGAFATYDDAAIGAGCPNEALRTAFSAGLPDCRAYELVTPPDTNGRSPKGVGFIGDRFPTVEVNPAGGAVSFLTEGGSLPGAGGSGAFNGDLYRSERGSSGWATVPAGPTGTESSAPDIGSTSPDQGYAFWVARVSGSAVIEGGETHYVRYPDGHSALVGRGSEGVDPRAIGKLITENGAHIVFQTPEIGSEPIQLEPNAPPSGTAAVYDRIKNPAAPGGEETKVVSLLPGDATPSADAKYLGASDNGEGVAFTVGGVLYLRVDNKETFEVGGGVVFAGVSEGGDRIFYMEGGDLKALDTTGGQPGVEIAFTNVGNATPVNVSKDGSRAYFVSTTEIPEAGENPNGAFPVAGQRNLYLSEEGEISFVGTVTARDVDGENGSSGPLDGLGLWTFALAGGELPRDPSRLNPDGAVMLFQSRADLTGYNPEGTSQVYRYDSIDDRLHCISCIPTKVKASGGASLQSFARGGDTLPPFSAFGFVPNLRADGKRAFFESTEALVSTDTNGVRDVYEWEEAGVGSCAKPGGCVYLISSGHGAENNYLYAHSASGDDVFFTTADILSGFDASETLSIYDARVNGGFAEPTASVCEGEGCRPTLTPAPSLPEPESGVRSQSGNPDRSCPKGKRKVKRGGKVVCVKKKHRKHRKHRKAGKTRKGASK